VLPEEPAKTLPRRVDLVYKAFLGTQGFLIGEAVYRFEHTGHEYHIMPIGEAGVRLDLRARGSPAVGSSPPRIAASGSWSTGSSESVRLRSSTGNEW
jgi:hypothetical protein